MRNLLTVAILLTLTVPVHAHEGEQGGSQSAAAARNSRVAIHSDGDKRIIESNGMPNHKTGEFPNRGNPNSIDEQRYRFEMPVKPTPLAEPQPIRRYLFGVAVNGVVFDPGTAEVWQPGDKIVSRPGPGTRMGPGQNRDRAWNYEGMGRMNLGIDASHAHVQPTGAYHYHGLPTGLIELVEKKEGKDKMLLIGYAADGYPIYAERGHTKADDPTSPLKQLKPSYKMKEGIRPTGEQGPGGKYDGTFVQDYEFIAGSGDLDQCNGRDGVTPEHPGGTYYYVVTDAFPFVPRFFHGKPDASFEKQGPPGGPSGRGGPPGRGGRRGPPPR